MNANFSRQLQALLKEKQFEAAHSLIASIENEVDAFLVCCYRASTIYTQGDFFGALKLIEEAISLAPKQPLPYKLAAEFAINKNRGKDALRYAKQGWELAPESPALVFLYIHALLDNAEIETCLGLLSQQSPKIQKSRSALLAYASCYRSQRNYENARRTILTLKNTGYESDPVTLRLEADIEADIDSQKGVLLYKHALDLQRQATGRFDSATQWNAALHLLRVREISFGWECYELGFHRSVGTLGRKLPDQLSRARRITLDTDLPQKDWFLLVPEQGLGDQVLFLSALPQFRNEISNFIFVADPRLKPVIKRSFKHLILADPGIIDGWDSNSISKGQFLTYGTMMARLRPNLQSFKTNKVKNLLVPNNDLVGQYSKRLEKAKGTRKVIGISWRGGYWASQKHNKGLEKNFFVDLFDKSVVYLNLQYGTTEDELQYFREHKVPVVHFADIDFTKDIDAWLALIAQCDYVVSISTALVHFSSTIGVPTFILMPEKQGPWVLGMDDEEHIVYEMAKILRPKDDKLPLYDQLRQSLRWHLGQYML